MGKKRIIKRFEQLSEELLNLVKEKYPDGFEESLISFTNASGEIEFGVPLETEEAIYLVKMPKNQISEEEDDIDALPNFDGFDNFENLEIADEVEEEEEEE